MVTPTLDRQQRFILNWNKFREPLIFTDNSKCSQIFLPPYSQLSSSQTSLPLLRSLRSSLISTFPTRNKFGTGNRSLMPQSIILMSGGVSWALNEMQVIKDIKRIHSQAGCIMVCIFTMRSDCLFWSSQLLYLRV